MHQNSEARQGGQSEVLHLQPLLINLTCCRMVGATGAPPRKPNQRPCKVNRARPGGSSANQYLAVQTSWSDDAVAVVIVLAAVSVTDQLQSDGEATGFNTRLGCFFILASTDLL